jgi:hypothetical protein
MDILESESEWIQVEKKGNNKIKKSEAKSNLIKDPIYHSIFPVELWRIIFEYLDGITMLYFTSNTLIGQFLARCSSVCKRWNEICNLQELWWIMCAKKGYVPIEGLDVKVDTTF